jgi:predicted DNA-binding ribbon-helix-helix protein
MKSLVEKRSMALAGHRTSVSLEEAFWQSLKEIAAARGTTLSSLVCSIDNGRQHTNLSSAIRLFVLSYYRGHYEGAQPNGHVNLPTKILDRAAQQEQQFG